MKEQIQNSLPPEEVQGPHLLKHSTFTCYDSLECAIYQYGSDDEKKRMLEYSEDIKYFMKITTIEQFENESWMRDIDQYQDIEVTELTMKFGIDPSTYTVKQLDELRRKICSKIEGLSDRCLILCKVQCHSNRPWEIVAKWMFPSDVCTEVEEATCSLLQPLYKEEGIVSVEVNKKEVVRSLKLMSACTIICITN
jgi:hypothetical protein